MVTSLRRKLRPALVVAATLAATGSAASISTVRADHLNGPVSTDATLIVAAPEGWHGRTRPVSDTTTTGSTSNVRVPAVIFAAGVLLIALGVRSARQET